MNIDAFMEPKHDAATQMAKKLPPVDPNRTDPKSCSVRTVYSGCTRAMVWEELTTSIGKTA